MVVQIVQIKIFVVFVFAINLLSIFIGRISTNSATTQESDALADEENSIKNIVSHFKF